MSAGVRNDGSISPLKLALVSLASPQSEREVLNGTLQLVHTVIKNHPFDVKLEWQKSTPTDPIPKPEEQHIAITLKRADTNTEVPEFKSSAVPWKRKHALESSLIELSVRISVLSSTVEGSCFRLHISVKDNYGAELAKPALSDAIRVIAKKATIERKRKRTEATLASAAPVAKPAPAPSLTAAADAIAPAPSAAEREGCAKTPTTETPEAKARPAEDLEQVELKLDLLRRLTAAAHSCVSGSGGSGNVGGALVQSTSVSAARPGRLAALSAPMKASTSELALPSLFGSLSELPTLSVSTLDLPLQASASGTNLAAPSPLPPTPSPVPLTAPPPPPPPPPLPPPAPSDEALDSALAVALALAGKDGAEVRAQKIRRFVKNHSAQNPSYVQIASELASAAAKTEEMKK